MDFASFLKPELAFLVPVLYILGAFFKGIPNIKDKYIPILLGCSGIVLSLLYLGASMDVTTTKGIYTLILTAVIQGLLYAGASVYGNQLFKQLTTVEADPLITIEAIAPAPDNTLTKTAAQTAAGTKHVTAGLPSDISTSGTTRA